MVSLRKAKDAVAQVRETIDTSLRVAIGALMLAIAAVVLSLVALAKVRAAS